MAIYTYECEVFPEGGRFFAASFELGISVSGESRDQAARMMTTALRAEVSRLLTIGEDVPEASFGNEPVHAGGCILISCFDASPIGLLETLQCKVGCGYLSDLRIPSSLPLIRHALGKMGAEDYSLREWGDAIEYITGKQERFERPSDAMGYLMNYACLYAPENEGRIEANYDNGDKRSSH